MRPTGRGQLSERVTRLLPGRRRVRALALSAALEAATGRGWPVVPGARALRGAAGPCSCADRACPTPGAHPDDPSLEAATTDVRMIRYWWERRAPGAPVLVATGRALGAVSLPRPAGPWLLRHLDEIGVPCGPVLGTANRYVLLTAPYTLPELGALLAERPWVPGVLRYHGPGGYLVLPPARTGSGAVHWVRRPIEDEPWLPQVGTLLGGLITASAVALPHR
ncbi:bifunctional DNA primase/polymerase [Kitasatospora sp. NPDC049285]|uniref:bifunctional DNA primase/polymerase n=1 Tax=Kitasatospora sp. NPDC049285 TaxID=3157096 RepID=UPI003413FD42